MNQMRQQPFFKPLTNNADNSNSFIYEQSVQNAAVRSKSNLNAPTFQVNKHKENDLTLTSFQQQDSMIGGERLSSLHSKLQQEADKIRKWRVQTEIELKQKEHNVKELTYTVESLRKSILELQLQNESLSLKLQEEMCNREEVYQRVCATRDICSLLKDHSAKTEDRLQKCETERTELKYLEKEHLKQFEELSVQFRNLGISATEKHNDLTNQLSIEKQEKNMLHEEWGQKESDAESKMKTLLDQSDDKDIEIRDIRSQLQNNDEQIHTLQLTHDALKEQIACCQGEFKQKKESHEITVKELENANKDYGDLTNNCQSLTEELEARKSAEEQLKSDLLCRSDRSETEINTLKLEIKSLNIHFDEHVSRIRNLEDELEKSRTFVEELKSTKDLLILEKAEIANKLHESEEKKAALLLSKKTDESKAHDLSAEIERLQEDLKLCENDHMNQQNAANAVTEEKAELQKNIMKLTQEMKLKMVELNQAKEELQASTENEEKLADEICCLKDSLEQECGNYGDILKDLQKAQDDIVSLEKNLTLKQKDLDKLQKENEKRRKSEEKLISGLEGNKHDQLLLNEELANVRQELEEKCRDNTELEEERETSKKTLQGELENLSKGTNELESKTKSLKSDLTAKNKHIKELEKEMKGLKSKLTNQTKSTESREDEIDQLKEELESTTSTIDDLKNQIVNQEKSVCQEKKRTDQEKKKADEMKKLSETAVKDKELNMQKSDMQMTEMMATLEKYKKENQKIVLQKEKELEQLKQRLEAANTQTKTENSAAILDLHTQIKQLKDTILETELHKIAWEKKIEEKDEQLSEFESDVQTKEREIVELLNAVKTQQSKQMQTISIQTSPQMSPVLPVPSTPFVAQTPVFVTPKLLQTPRSIPIQRDCTPQQCITPVVQSDMKTPQRSILKTLNIGSATKKRRVIFASDNKEESHGDSDSSSELMEVEIDEIESRYKKDKKSTPLHLRPSPKIPLTSPKYMKEKNIYLNDKENTERLSITRVPRGPPVSAKRKEVCSQSFDSLKGMEKKKDIIAERQRNDTPLCSDKKKKKQDECKTPNEKNFKLDEFKISNVRKTPSKTQGKFFKNSPKERMKKTKLEESETSWFDLDTVFGFGPED